MSERRKLYLVLSPSSLPYADYAIRSLWKQSAEPLHLHLITDSRADRDRLHEYMQNLPAGEHRWNVYADDELTEREAERFSRFPNLRSFRRGHPCWRKITDPLLLTDPGSEMVLLDPDLYFPNDFTFEMTPPDGVLLMWQKPNCLVPVRIVRMAMQAGIPLAHHVDIGVAHWRGPSDMEWLEWLIGRLGGAQLPRLMHIEAIVWAALAMEMGGGYLDPQVWHCWHRTQPKRVMRLLGVRGPDILRSEPWHSIKCFHGGGEAKNWIPGAVKSGIIGEPRDCVQTTQVLPFVELAPAAYEREQAIKRMLRKTGYYRLFRSA